MMHVTERQRLYAFLARLFGYPDRELLEALHRGEGDAARPLGEAPPPPSVPESLREVEIAYTSLFINRLGGAAALPYGSVYLDPEGMLMGETARRAAEAYRAEGLSLEGTGEPPDYLPTELEFLYYLAGEERKALERRDLGAARRSTALQAEFCRALLHPWIPEFCARVEADEGAHPLYLWGSAVLRSFCRAEAEWLDRLHPCADGGGEGQD